MYYTQTHQTLTDLPFKLRPIKTIRDVDAISFSRLIAHPRIRHPNTQTRHMFRKVLRSHYRPKNICYEYA